MNDNINIAHKNHYYIIYSTQKEEKNNESKFALIPRP